MNAQFMPSSHLNTIYRKMVIICTYDNCVCMSNTYSQVQKFWPLNAKSNIFIVVIDKIKKKIKMDPAWDFSILL